MILAFQYYDPFGKYNLTFQRQLPLLKSSFEAICLSVVPPTSAHNADFVQYLKEQGCLIADNASDPLYGYHSRAALRLAVEQVQGQQPIFFGFMERILFALETEWRTPFLQNLKTYQAAEFVLFERSPHAWESHPANFREIEQMASRMFEWMHGQFIDLMPCAFLLSQPTAQVILDQSSSSNSEVWGEWVLLALKNRIPITTHAEDWLAWKDPYWENVEPEVLKRQREMSQAETIKRIKMNVPVMLMLTEERFRHL